MIIDLILCIILVLSTVWYAHKGLARSVRSTLEWLACIALGLFFCDDVSRLLSESPLGDWMRSGFEEKFSGTLGYTPAVDATPGVWKSWTEGVIGDAAEAAASAVTNIVLTVLAFIVMIAAVKLALFIAARVFSKEYHDGLIGWVDGVGGGALGLFLGVIYALLFLAALIPLMTFLSPAHAESVRNALDASVIAGYVFDNNPLLRLIGIVF